MSIRKLIFEFGAGRADGDPTRKDLLGGKGASLASMSLAGLPVPPGFTISAECCEWVASHGGEWPLGLEDDVRAALQRLEAATQRRFGIGPRPLLVAVRSGASVSMPGMMDTILNCGLNPSLLDSFPDADRFWLDYADHVRMFAKSAADVTLPEVAGGSPREVVESHLRSFLDRTGSEFPSDSWEVLRRAINAVFASWQSERAIAYRRHHNVRGVPGTAVTVQMMFPSQRAGVLFTANPNDPEANEIVLEAACGLGEAVVSGAVTPDIVVLDRESLAIKHMTVGEGREGNELAPLSPVLSGGREGLGVKGDCKERPVNDSLSPPAFLLGVPGRGERDPALTPAQIHELIELGLRCEQHFGAPSDIEWGLADGEFVLLQARPIRGLDVLRDVEIGRLAEINRLRASAGDEHVVWVVHNLSETLPAPTPLTWDIIQWFMSGLGGFGQLYRLLGYQPSPRVDRDGFLELICGRIYADPRRAAEVFWGSLPFEYEAQSLLLDPRALERAPTKFNVDRADPLCFLRLCGWLWSSLRCSRRTKQLRRDTEPRFARAVAKLDEFLIAAQATDLRRLSTSELLTEFHRRREYVLGEFAAESLLPGFFAGVAQNELSNWLSRLLGEAGGQAPQNSELAERDTIHAGDSPPPNRNSEVPDPNHVAPGIMCGSPGRSPSLDLISRPTTAQSKAAVAPVPGLSSADILSRLTTGLEHDITVEQNLELARVARGELSLDEFLTRFGHRTTNEMELSQSRWSEDSSLLERMLAGFRSAGTSAATSPAERHARQVAARLAAEAALPGQLAESGASSFRERVQSLVAETQRLLPYRELGKYHLMRGYATLRAVLMELGERWDLGADVFFLRLDELSTFEASTHSARVAERKLRWKSAQKLMLADVIDSRRLEELGQQPAAVLNPDSQQLEARPIAAGVATGVARIVTNPDEIGDLGSDYILVCPSTDPGWTPLFVQARGLIVERGGVLSHGAIVARDFGIPAVVCPQATRLIAEGAMLQIDGNRGVIVVSRQD